MERDPSYESSFEISFKSPACNPKTADTMAECKQDKSPECDHKKDVYVECGKFTMALRPTQ